MDRQASPRRTHVPEAQNPASRTTAKKLLKLVSQAKDLVPCNMHKRLYPREDAAFDMTSMLLLILQEGLQTTNVCFMCIFSECQT